MEKECDDSGKKNVHPSPLEHWFVHWLHTHAAEHGKQKTNSEVLNSDDKNKCNQMIVESTKTELFYIRHCIVQIGNEKNEKKTNNDVTL